MDDLSADEWNRLANLRVDNIAAAKESLIRFAAFNKSDYDANWHHIYLCEKLDQLVRGEITRLLVCMPPRHGKSELVSRMLPAYAFGHNPNEQIIAASYSADLATRMNRDTQRIIDSVSYREVFPAVGLNGSNVRSNVQGSYLRNNDIFEIVGHNGVYRSTGVGGGITGMGFTLGIIDDPVKSSEDADSPVYRQKVWDWYVSTFLTRAEKGARVLITMTLWHEDDLGGRVKELMDADPEADQFEVVVFPAICESHDNPDDPRDIGDALWPNKFPLKKLEQTRATVGPRVWNALYQQRPSAMEGNLIKRDWIAHYDTLPQEFDEMVITADLTFKKAEFSDFAVVECWGRKGANCYWIDGIRDRMNFPEQLTAIRSMSSKYPGVLIEIEEAANGAAVIQTLKDEIPGIVPVKPKTSKEARVQAVAHVYEAGNVWYPNPRHRPMIQTNIEELVSFPNARNDDTVDTATMAISRLTRAGASMRRIAALGKW